MRMKRLEKAKEMPQISEKLMEMLLIPSLGSKKIVPSANSSKKGRPNSSQESSRLKLSSSEKRTRICSKGTCLVEAHSVKEQNVDYAPHAPRCIPIQMHSPTKFKNPSHTELKKQPKCSPLCKSYEIIHEFPKASIAEGKQISTENKISSPKEFATQPLKQQYHSPKKQIEVKTLSPSAPLSEVKKLVADKIIPSQMRNSNHYLSKNGSTALVRKNDTQKDSALSDEQRYRMVKRDYALLTQLLKSGTSRVTKDKREQLQEHENKSLSPLSQSKLRKNLGLVQEQNCSLCCRTFLPINLTGVVSCKAIIDLRSTWEKTYGLIVGNRKLSPTKKSNKVGIKVGYYKPVKVCAFCFQMFDGQQDVYRPSPDPKRINEKTRSEGGRNSSPKEVAPAMVESSTIVR